MNIIPSAMILLGLGLCAPSFATPAGGENPRLEVCRMASEIAKVIARKRQDGFPMSDLMDICGTMKEESAISFCSQVVASAYSRPRFATAFVQAQEVKDFTNSLYLECYKSP